MKTLSVIKAALGGGTAILLSGLLAAPAAHASTGVTVPCKSAALIAAISAANSSGGATINLAPGCTYQLTAANNTNPMLGANGLPVITSRITLNGSRTTIAGNNSTFRIFMVSDTGNLTLQGPTITGGSTPGPGGGIFNLEGALTLNHSTVTGNASAGGMMSAGGGLASGTLGTGPLGTTTLNFSSVTGNTTSGSAGGILNHGGTLVEVTITPAGPAPGGPLTLTLSQVTGNTAAQGGGIFAVPGSPVTLKLTLIARNAPDNCAPPGSVTGCKN